MPFFAGPSGQNKILGLTKTSEDQWSIKSDTIFHSSMPYVEVVEHDLTSVTYLEAGQLYATVMDGGITSPYYFQNASLYTREGTDYWNTTNPQYKQSFPHYVATIPAQLRDILLNTETAFMVVLKWSDGSEELLPAGAKSTGNAWIVPPQFATEYLNQKNSISPWDLTGESPNFYFVQQRLNPNPNGTLSGGLVSLNADKVVGVTILELKGLNISKASQDFYTSPLNTTQTGEILLDRASFKVGGTEYKNKKFLQVFSTDPVLTNNSTTIDTSGLQALKIWAGLPSVAQGYALDYLVSNRQSTFATTGTYTYHIISSYWSKTPLVTRYSGATRIGHLLEDAKGHSSGSNYTNPIIDNSGWSLTSDSYQVIPTISYYQGGHVSQLVTKLGTDSFSAYLGFYGGLPSTNPSIPQLVPIISISSLSKAAGLSINSTVPSIDAGAYKMFSPVSNLIGRVGTTYRVPIPVPGYIYSGDSGTTTFPQYTQDLLVGRITLNATDSTQSKFFLAPRVQDQDTKPVCDHISYSGALMDTTDPAYPIYFDYNQIPRPIVFFQPPSSARGGLVWYKGQKTDSSNSIPITGISQVWNTDYNQHTYTVGFPVQPKTTSRRVSVITLPVGYRYVLSEENRGNYTYYYNQDEIPRGIRQFMIYLYRSSQTTIEIRLSQHQTLENSKFDNSTQMGIPPLNQPTVINTISLCPILPIV